MTSTVIAKALATDDFDLPVMIEKAVEAQEITKAEFGEFLNRRVLRLKLPTETFEKAYSRLLADGQDHVGGQLFKIYMATRGPEAHTVAILKAMEAKPKTGDEGDDSPMAKLNRMRDEIRASNPSLTKEQAFTKAMMTPVGMQLYGEDKARRLQVN